LAAFPTRRLGSFATDIEGILEDFGLEIIYRGSLGLPVEGYAARDPRYIVISEGWLHYIPRMRFTIAEELSHRILEFSLWNDGKKEIPSGARLHELSGRQFKDIESDAKALAGELLQPERLYKERFAHHEQEETKRNANVKGDQKLKNILRAVAEDFQVSPASAAFRGKVLNFIDGSTWSRLFPPIL
jgi:Zn-dependent peptidase ImmA (M78 family)